MNLARDQSQPGFGVHRSFMFGEHDQGGSALIQPRIHSGGDFYPACERQSNVDAVTHLVGDERSFDFLDDFLAGWNFRERQSVRGAMQSVEMFVEFENATVI